MDLSLPGILDELRYSEAALRPYLESLDSDLQSFTGRAYRAGRGKSAPENHALEWFSLMRGQLLMGNPKCRFTSDVPGDPQARALALTHACNTLSRRLQLRKLNEQLLVDFGFKWAVALIAAEPQPGYSGANDAPLWPAAYRISPRRFRYDVAASRVEAREWSAHLLIENRKKLKSDKKWNAEVLDKIEEMDVKKFRDPDNKTPKRDEVAIWEVWVRDHELEKSPGEKEGYYGTLFWVIDNQPHGTGWVREPEPYFGPPWGPYVVGGDYVVPDDSTPMGPLTASSQQADYLNRIKRATQRGVEKYKNLVFVQNGNNIPDIVKNGADQFVFSIDAKDMNNVVTQVQIAGITDQHIVAGQDAQATLDKVSGITDLMRGQVDHRNKATADALAAQASGNRTSGTVANFRDMTTRLFWSFAWMFDRDDEISIDLGPEAAGLFVDAQGNPTTTLTGGLNPNQSPEEFFKLSLELSVGSMERDLESDTAFKLQIVDTTIQQLAALGPQTALYLDWQSILEAKAELTGVQELKKIVDVDVMRAIGAQMLQQQASGEGPKPSMGSNITYNVSKATPAQKTTVAGSSRVKHIAATADQ